MVHKMQKHLLKLLTSFILCASFGVYNSNAQSSWVKDNNNCRYLKIDDSNYKIECNGTIWQDEPDESENSIMMNLNDTAKKIAIKNKKKWYQINNFNTEYKGNYKKSSDGSISKPAITKANLKIGKGKMPSDAIEINPNYHAG